MGDRMDRDDVADRRDGWEYLLLASELEAGIAAHEEEWRDFEVGFARPTGEPIVDRGAAFADLSARSAEILKTVSNIL